MTYDKYDKRLESLVMETQTAWDPSVAQLSAEDRAVVARELHAHPELASKIGYERSHTGFTRHITVTLADIERLYRAKVHA